MGELGRSGNSVLDPAQLRRIEAVHRGYLFQHLYAVQCLLSAATIAAREIAVESDEDVEIQLDGIRIYVQVKHRKDALAWDDIEGAMSRFADLAADSTLA
ncbi:MULTISPECIES: hypothetical protein [Rhizobium/Agrobacterium group]|uniref:Restriction endonuclease type IV Mrr domain-containing protein n=5 Tax=Rhizobium/Agrobacterium group TaxID=227290 RepID=A0A2Z2PL38_RHIRH|nr:MULTISPECIES: hypothetical protein [Rhizobium/Agrobacterium group]AQS65420.1 hypothetical protein B0909_23855 [Rhizobium rhizogenes]ASK42861.1 hypothetical protein [Rhizobium rhizogenes]MCZ7445585.1 hypothetical protein [Rhizobium rhizogenes]MCZ7472468.1 hypothetical protein [Rhizobium rhizogenes]MCZ7483844.1 hypothetical protein [Rhizobium rhizogenes]